MKTISQKEQQQRKFLKVAPLLVLPFIIMIFWSLGGGKDAGAKTVTQQQVNGLDTHLPDSQKQDDKNADKLSFYQQAEKDSARLRDELRNDPYHTVSALSKDTNTVSLNGSSADSIHLHAYSSFGGSANTISTYPEPNEAKISEKLAEINKQISDAQSGAAAGDNSNLQLQMELQKMNAMKNANQNTSDPDMQQLSGMLDKILYIEHPELAKEKIKEQSLKNKKQVFTVSTGEQDNDIQLMGNSQVPTSKSSAPDRHKKHTGLQTDAGGQQNAFYDLNKGTHGGNSGNTVEAVVAETRTLVAGSTIKLRLLSDIYINGTLIPRDQFVFGTCSIAGDRLLVSLSSIRYNNSIFPIELSAYDMDGIAGVYIPDAIGRQVAKGSADQTINGIDLYSFDNSLKGQAASAGVQGVKSLFSKKAELIKVTVKDGYKVFLKNNNIE